MRGLYRPGEVARSGSSGEGRVPEVPIVAVSHCAPGAGMLRAGFVLAVVLAAGCHAHFAATPPHPAAPPQLPLTARTPTEPDVSVLPAAASPGTPTRPTSYRRLTAAECRTLAIKNAPLADELDTHPDNTPPAHHLSHTDPELAERSRLVR